MEGCIVPANTLTFDPVASTVLPSPTNQIIISDISQSYTDLVLILSGTWASGNTQDVYMQFNGDTGSNYPWARALSVAGDATIYPDGNSPATGPSINAGLLSSSGASMAVWQIMSYSNSSIGTTVLSRSSTPEYNSWAVGSWHNTAAVTSIRLFNGSLNFTAGTVASLYGILKA
jgi:hypothetical protein